MFESFHEKYVSFSIMVNLSLLLLVTHFRVQIRMNQYTSKSLILMQHNYSLNQRVSQEGFGMKISDIRRWIENLFLFFFLTLLLINDIMFSLWGKMHLTSP